MPTMVPVATIIVPPLCLLLTLALQFHKMEVQCLTLMKTFTYSQKQHFYDVKIIFVVIHIHNLNCCPLKNMDDVQINTFQKENLKRK